MCNFGIDPVVHISWLCSARAEPQSTNGDNFIYFSFFIYKRIFFISWRFFLDLGVATEREEES